MARAAAIVWLSGLVSHALLALLLFRGLGAWTLTGLVEHVGGGLWRSQVFYLVTGPLLGAIGVVAGTRLVGFRIGYPSAVFALVAGTILVAGLGSVVLSHTSGGTTDLAAPAYGVGLVPFRVLLGVVLPAYLVDAATSPPRSSAARAADDGEAASL